jgi:hypothetical protein
MPLYSVQVIVPPQTPVTDRVVQTVEVDEQAVTSVTVFLDSGSSSEVEVIVTDGESRIVPAANGDPISKPGETGPVEFSPARRLPGKPSDVSVRVAAPDADFEHTVIVQIETTEVSDADPIQRLIQRLTPTDVSDRFEDLDTVEPDSN